MAVYSIKELPPKPLIVGTQSRFIHTNNMTLGYWEFEPGVALPEHAHPHEQVSHIISGAFEFTIDNEVTKLNPGDIAVIPPNAVHSGRALTQCTIIDVFHPVREDFR